MFYHGLFHAALCAGCSPVVGYGGNQRSVLSAWLAILCGPSTSFASLPFFFIGAAMLWFDCVCFSNTQML